VPELVIVPILFSVPVTWGVPPAAFRLNVRLPVLVKSKAIAWVEPEKSFAVKFIVPVTRGITISGGPRFAWESTDAISPYFSINAAQAMATGLPIFNAMGGAHSAGAGMQVKYQINPQWEVHSFVEYDRLLGDAANSPLVTARGSVNQTTVGIGASYSFDVKIR